MNLQGRQLRVNMRGEDVSFLQQELRLLGYQLLDADGRYGKDTRKAVLQFQEQNGLQSTGIVDQKTALFLSEALEQGYSEITKYANATFRVSGNIVDSDKKPLPAITVRAFSKRVRSEILLGQTLTDREGHYSIQYDPPFDPGNSPTVHFFVCTYNQVGKLLSKSDVCFGAKPSEEIDLTIPLEALRISKFEEYIAQLSPHLGGTPLAQINDDDIDFLAQASGLDQEMILMLAEASRIAEATNLPIAVLYGLRRFDVSIDPENLVIISAKDVKRLWAMAVEEGVIPAASLEEQDDVLQRLDVLRNEEAETQARKQIVKSAKLQILNDKSKEPLAGHIIHLLKKGRNPNDDSLGYVFTDPDGFCTIGYSVDPQNIPAETTLKLDICTPDSKSLLKKQVRIKTSGTDIKKVEIPVHEIPQRTVSIDTLENTVQLGISDEIRDKLNQLSINTLADVRDKGRLAKLPGLASHVEKPIITALEAHAQLDILTADIAVNDSLVRAGYNSIIDVAEAKFDRLRADLGDAWNNDQVMSLRNKAIAQSMMLDNLSTRLRADFANNMGMKTQIHGESGFKCSCPDCEATVSPPAYLAELLSYAVKHIRQNGNKITIQELSELLYQPLAELPASCREMDNEVTQVRLCIEVLRRYLRDQQIDVPQQNISQYLEKAYRALLANHNLDYDALRKARGSNTETRKALANRCNLTSVSQLDKLVVKKDALAEKKLELLFGLVDTSFERHSLSDGPVYGLRSGEITRWNLDGVEYNRNTNADGEIYVHFYTEQQIVKVGLFKGRSRDNGSLLASGESTKHQGTVELKPENKSGLSGHIAINYIPHGNDSQLPPPNQKIPVYIRLSCIPMLLSWRLANLHQKWHAKDWPGNSDDNNSSVRPIVDPDLIGPEYIRTEIKENPAWQLWQDRSEELADLLNNLRNKLTDKSALERFNGLLEEHLIMQPGKDLLNELTKKLADGNSIENDLMEHHLDYKVFNFLVRLQSLVSTTNPQIQDDEWEALYAILIEASKRRQFADWRTQEKEQKLTLSPDYFVIPEKYYDPQQVPQTKQLPDWRASRTDQRDWEDRLQSRIDQQQTLTTAFCEAIKKTEEQVLMFLRDSLVNAITEKNGDLHDKAKWVTKNFLIDAKTGTCKKSTRIGQAISTLKLLLEGIGESHVYATNPDLSLIAPNFEEEWKWLGDYNTWRAAIFAFLYPENILLPNLRRHQTPAFIKLVRNLRKNRQLDPEQACFEAQSYSQYFQDICNLEAEASCYATTRIFEGTCRNRKEKGTKNLFYTFARARGSNTVYWSSYDSDQEDSGYSQSFWTEVEGLSNVINIVGAQPYDIPNGERYIYLFIRTRNIDEEQLQFVRYDLERQIWSGTAETLDLPQDTNDFTAVVKQTHLIIHPPRVIIRSDNNGAIYGRSLAMDGSEWAENDENYGEGENEEEWPPLVSVHRGQEFNKLLAAVVIKEKSYAVVVQGKLGGVYYRIFGDLDDGSWQGDAHASHLGSFSMPKEPILYLLLKKQNVISIQSYSIKEPEYKVLGPPSYDYKKEVILKGFNSWLLRTASVNLYDLEINIESWPSYQKHPENVFQLLVEEYSYQGATPSSKKYTGIVNNVLVEVEKKIKDDPAWSYANRLCKRFSKFNQSIVGFIRSILLQKSIHYILERPYEKVDTLNSTLPQEIDRLVPFSANYLEIIGKTQQFAFQSSGLLPGPYRLLVHYEGNTNTLHTDPYGPKLLAPVDFPLPITEKIPRKDLQGRHLILSVQFAGLLLLGPRSNLTYLEEAYYFVSLEIARRLQALGYYSSALSWYRTVFDYTVHENNQSEQEKIYPPLIWEEYFQGGYDRTQDWLLDPLNPHAVAATRPSTYTRFTLSAIISCLLDYADAEFTNDTADSIDKAQSLYITAQGLLDRKELRQEKDGCEKIIAELDVEILNSIPEAWWPKWRRIKNSLSRSNGKDAVKKVADTTMVALANNDKIADIILEAEENVLVSGKSNQGASFQKILINKKEARNQSHTTILQNPELVALIQQSTPDTETTGFVSTTYSFCVSPNPVLEALRLKAENSLHKIRTCRNIAGMKREVEPYSGATDQVSGLPQIGTGGQIVLPGTGNIRPTPYRFGVLIEKAKQLTFQAQQMEAAMLTSIEKRDAEAYNYKKASQDLDLTKSTVHLQKLRLKETNSGVTFAEQQKERSVIQLEHYQQLIDKGLNEYEQASLANLIFSLLVPTSVSWNSVSYSPSGFYQTGANIYSTLASYERREQSWQFQKELADQDILIGDQQIRISEDRVKIAEQEGVIADLQKDHAKDTVEFLNNKFTNIELYDWMADTLEGVYTYFLSEATSVARLAENQLVFERQKSPQSFIQNNYWDAPSEDSTFAGSGNAQERRGLTGSARLLQDITQLDQYAFETDKIQKPLSKSFHLAQIMPAEFQRFRETGILHFATPMEYFDQKFPGHYMRLIKKVSISVIALIPPSEGISATLKNPGISRVVIGNEMFQKVVVRRDPEWVALTSPRNATGVIEMQAQREKLLPFEGMGVDSSWELRMPKAANQFDFNTIADVIVTIDYTSQYSSDYYNHIIQLMQPSVSANRAFSFRHELADAWYDLLNPDLTDSPLIVGFSIDRSHFPPNLERIRIEHFVLYFPRKEGENTELETRITFEPVEEKNKPVEQRNSFGGEAQSQDGMINTRFSSGNSLLNLIGKKPLGQWQLDFASYDQTVARINKKLFTDGKIEDVLLVITYKGDTHPWPQQ